MNMGFNTSPTYDNCRYEKKLQRSVSPFEYQMFLGKYENCNKCRVNEKIIKPFDLVDIESELWNINKPLSDCDKYKYNSTNGKYTSTFSANAPVVLPPNLCPIVRSNNRRQNFTLPKPKLQIC